MSEHGARDGPPGAAGAQPGEFGIGRLFWQIREAVIVADADTGRIILWNPAAETLFGYSVEEAQTLTVDVLVPDELRARHRAGMARYRDTGHGPFVDSGIPLDVPARRKGGGEIAVELTLAPIDHPDRAGRFVLAVIRDVTDRRRAEDERARRVREQAARLQDRAAEWRLAFLASASTVLAASLDYRTTLATVARLAVPQIADWCTVHVLDAGGIIQRVALAHVEPAKEQLLRDLRRRYPLRADGPHPVAEVLRTGRSALYPEVTESLLKAITHDAEHLEMLRVVGMTSYMCVPLTVQGQMFGALALVSAGEGRRYGPADLSLAENLARRAAIAIENARLYDQAQAALRETEAALTVRERFLSSASHELRTPLTALKGYVQIMRRRLARGVPAREIAELIERVDAQADRLAGLVNELLDVSRIAAGRLTVERAPVPLSPVVRHAVNVQRVAEPERLIELDLPAESPVASVDPGRIEEVIAILIENARKYSPADRPIRVRLATAAGVADISVQDEGIGVPPEEHRRIFERFHRGSNIDPGISGMGIGLYIASEIVRLHDGTLTVESSPGSGSTFTVRLPTEEVGEPADS